jgi:tRNA(adenine34) deaminase
LELVVEKEREWMKLALIEAQKALAEGEVPVGAVVVHDNKIIGKGHNQTEALQDPTAHAEIIAISAAANTLRSWRLGDCSIYVTMEPCSMCAGAIVLARVSSLVFGVIDPKAGACGSIRNIVQDHRLNHRVDIVSGILESEASALLKSFFKHLRSRKR